MFHFEVHRERQLSAPSLSGSDPSAEPNAPKKEIVDWGEDGKAIYADGTTGSEEVNPISNFKEERGKD